ncbi:hypothetical protein ABIA27_004909 [Sinorhizobium fredii]
MAVGTPAHLIAAGATATTATSTSFTPSANVRMFALATGRGASSTEPTLTDSLGGTWTAVSGSSIDQGSLWGILFYQDVGSSPAARTVTVTSTGATQVGVEVCEISGTGGAISSNFQVGVSTVGDPAVTMAAYAASSICVAWGIGSAGSAWAPPSGFSEAYDLSPATNVRLNVSYDMVSPGTSLTWASTSTDSIGYALEVTEAAGGAVSGTLAATESGSDAFAGSGAVAIAGSLGLTEAGQDTAAASGSVRVSGALAAAEAGADGFAAAGAVAVAGTLAAAESGGDTFAGSGSQASTVTGTLAATESGSDSAAAAGSVLVAGTLAASEAGVDTAAGAGVVLVAGILAATETGADEFAANDDQLGSPSADRTTAVQAENRTAAVAAENRTAAVAAENRTAAV